MKKRALSFLLALVMVISMLPLSMLSALEVSAEATTPTVTLVVTPETAHPVVSEGTYSYVAALALKTTAPFTLGSLEFSMTPAEGISVSQTKATEGDTAIVLNDAEGVQDENGDLTGEMKFTYMYDSNNLKELAADTVYDLGSVTLSSAAEFGLADVAVVTTVAAKYDSEQTEGEKYPFEYKLDTYAKGDHEKADTVWTPLSGTISELLEEGHYYLTGETTIGKDVFGDAFKNTNITICLNGKELKGPGNGRLFRMSSGVTLTICDCTAHAVDVVDAEGNPTGEKEYVAGKITNKNADSVGFNGINGSIVGMYVNATQDPGNTFNLEDGILDGCGQTIGTKLGGAIHIGEPKAVVNINGGEIKDFAAVDGGAIYVTSGGDVNVTGGKIYGNEANRGGAIFIKSGTLNVSGGVIDGNTANTYGGVAYVDKDNNSVAKMINVSGGTFSNNTATEDGGVFQIPANTKGTKNEVTISNATFTGNAAKNGGAICGNAKLTITDTKFIGNEATSGEGGAIYVFDNALSVTDGEMKDNTAAKNGGALRIQASKATLSGGTYSGNVVHATATTNADGKTTYSNGMGGVAYIAGTDAQLDITGGTYSENTAYHGSVAFANNATICNVTDATIQDNIGERMAAFYISGGKLNVTGTTMTGNEAKGAGGSALYVEKSSQAGVANLKDTTITGNTGGNAAVYVGGTASALTVSGKVVIKANGNGNLYFNKDYAAGQKNLLYVNELEEGFISVSTSDTRTDANTLVQIAEGGSQSDWDTGWIQYSKNTDQLALNEAKTGFQWVAHSHADYEKFNPDATWQKWGDTTAELTSLPTSGYYYLVADIAPAAWATLNDASKNLVICLNGHTITATDRAFRVSNGAAATICDCTACGSITDGTYTAGTIYAGTYEGGVASIYGDANDAGNSSFTMYDGILDGKSATRTTGVVYTGQATSTVSLLGGVIRNVTIKDADTTAARGAVTTTGCTLTVDGMLFDNCVNTHTDDTKTSQEPAKGAALTFSAANTNKVEIKNSVFKNNYAYATGSYTSGTLTVNNDGYGCAIYAAGNAASVASITNCVFENNRSEMGALSLNGAGNENRLKLTISNCKFLNNSGTYGAAVWSLRGNPIFTGCVFDGNISTNASGAGFYGETSTRAYFSDSTFTNNKGGAALWIQATSSRTVLSGKMVFDGNTNSCTGDVYFPSPINANNNNKLHINELTADSKISVGSSDERTAPDVIAISSEDTDAKQTTWETSWVRYNGKAINYADDGTGTKVFSFVEAEHTHGTDTLQAWTSGNTLPETSGKYYLTRNVKLSGGNVNVGENSTPVADGAEDTKKDITITLCLNGYSITAGTGRIYRLSNGANLTICDCTEHLDSAGNYVAGKLVPHATVEGGVIGMYPAHANDTSTNNTVFTMEGGIIDGTGVASTKNSVAINGAYITDSENIYSVVNLNGGEIRNCSTTQNGIVTIRGHGKLNMKDFVIRNCSAGGNGIVRAEGNAILNVQDSQIIDNNAYRGAAFYDDSKESQYTNVTISGNTGTNYGALFLVGGTKILENVTITDNTAPYVSAIYAESSAQVTLNNCDIQNNSAEEMGAVSIRNGNAGLTVKGDTKITNNVGGNVTLDNRSGSNVIARAFINLANVTANTKIGVGFINFKSGSDVAAKITDGTYKAGALYPDEMEGAVLGLTNDVTGDNNDKVLYYAEATTDDGQTYQTLQAAVNSTAAGEGELITLQQDSAEAVTVSQDVVLDLNGNNVTGAVTGTGKVTLIDNKTDDYNVDDEDGYGMINIDATQLASDYKRVDGKRYVVLAEEIEGETYYSAHRVYVNVTAKALRPREDKPGIGFQARFAGDSKVLEQATGYGVRLQIAGNAYKELDVVAIDGNKDRALDGQILYFTVNEIMDIKNTADVNNTNAAYVINGTPYITIGTGENAQRIDAADVVQANIVDMFNYANAQIKAGTLGDAPKAMVLKMYNKFVETGVFTNAQWETDAIAAEVQ